MSEKRKRNAGDGSGDHKGGGKKPKRGFVVGPDHLPDGTYKRKSMCLVGDARSMSSSR